MQNMKPGQTAFFILIVFGLCPWICKAQSSTMKNTNVKEILSQGKDSLVLLAREKIREKAPEININFNDYEASVWANQSEVVVKFSRLIRYVMPGNNFYYYDLSVNLVTGEVTPFDCILYRDNFFMPTPDQQKVIDYLKVKFDLPVKHMENSVSEEEEYYHLSLTSKTSFCHILIHKITGEQSEPLEGSYLMPEVIPEVEEEEDALKEVVW